LPPPGDLLAAGVAVSVRGGLLLAGSSAGSAGSGAAASAVTAEVLHLREMDAGGRPTGRDAYGLRNAAFALTATGQSSDYGPAAAFSRYTAALPRGGSAELGVHLVLAEGLLRAAPGEFWPVAPGAAKLAVTVTGWPFCPEADGCEGVPDGQWLELALAVRGMDGASPEGRDVEFDVPAGGRIARLRLSRQVRVDGAWQALPEGFPAVRRLADGLMSFVVRLPRFDSDALYDPLISGLTGPEAPTPPRPPAASPAVSPAVSPAAPAVAVQLVLPLSLSGGVLAGLVIVAAVVRRYLGVELSFLRSGARGESTTLKLSRAL